MNDFDGIVTFYSSHFALRAESLLKKNSMDCRLIPGPKELSPNCGVALQFKYEDKLKLMGIFSQGKVCFEAIHEYRIQK
jgi:hypothetical protein